MANWKLIKEQYISGIPPRELAKKYKVSAQTISNRATGEQWALEKSKNQEEIADRYREQINELIDLSLPALREIIKSEGLGVDAIKPSEKIQAIKAALDISGLKSEKRENHNVDKTPLEIKILK